MASLPFLIKDLSPQQRMRVLAMDYVTGCGFVPPEDWLLFSKVIEYYLTTGEVVLDKAKVHTFPRPVD